MCRLRQIFLAIPLCFIALNGCILVPFIDSAREIGFTKEQRETKLAEDVKAFNSALFWGDLPTALNSVEEISRPDVRKVLAQTIKEGRTVEVKVAEVEFVENSFIANVDVVTKRYSSSTLIVKDYEQKQRWRFHMGEGWKLVTVSS